MSKTKLSGVSNIIGIYLIILTHKKLILNFYFKSDTLNKNIKKMNYVLKHYKLDLNENINEKIEILKKLIISYRQIKDTYILSTIKEEKNSCSIMDQHAELFFSLEILENINVIKLINKGNYGKIFLMNHKLSKNNDFYNAMRVVPKYWYSSNTVVISKYKKYKKLEKSLIERNIGFYECPFFVKTYSTFENKVYLKKIN